MSFSMVSSFLKSHIFFRDWIRSLPVDGDWDRRAHTSHRKVPASILLPCHGMSLCRSDIYDQKNVLFILYGDLQHNLYFFFVLSILILTYLWRPKKKKKCNELQKSSFRHQALPPSLSSKSVENFKIRWCHFHLISKSVS